MKKTRTYKYEYQLEKGDVVKIQGFPFEYLGDGVIGGSVDLDPVVVDGFVKKCNCDGCSKGKTHTGIWSQPASMRFCKTPGCRNTFGPEAPWLPEYCPQCQDETIEIEKDCKCIQPCDCPVTETQVPQESAIESLQKLVEALEKDSRVLKGDQWSVPKGGFILDPPHNIVYGPGCNGGSKFGDVKSMKIGEGCCSPLK